MNDALYEKVQAACYSSERWHAKIGHYAKLPVCKKGSFCISNSKRWSHNMWMTHAYVTNWTSVIEYVYEQRKRFNWSKSTASRGFKVSYLTRQNAYIRRGNTFVGTVVEIALHHNETRLRSNIPATSLALAGKRSSLNRCTRIELRVRQPRWWWKTRVWQGHYDAYSLIGADGGLTFPNLTFDSRFDNDIGYMADTLRMLRDHIACSVQKW